MVLPKEGGALGEAGPERKSQLKLPCFIDAICEQQLIVCIKSGNRPNVEDIIEYCPKEIISIMKECWEANPEVRPTFTGKDVFL